jgi:hypothetical protein
MSTMAAVGPTFRPSLLRRQSGKWVDVHISKSMRSKNDDQLPILRKAFLTGTDGRNNFRRTKATSGCKKANGTMNLLWLIVPVGVD